MLNFISYILSLLCLICGFLQKGIFGADMAVQIENDGPVTLVLDSQNKAGK